MNRLIRVVISFVLPLFCLLFSVNYTNAATLPELPELISDQSYRIVYTSSSSGKVRCLVYDRLILGDDNIVICSPNGEYYTCSVIRQNDGDPSATFSIYWYFLSDNSWVQDGKSYTQEHVIDFSEIHYSDFNIYNSDGSIFYKASSSEPDTPSLPSNSEIAQAVQSFYNSDYYKNNKDFSDFIVMYNYDTQYFSFVGHNFGTNLGQVIVPPDYEYEGYSYKQDWWKFFLRNISSQIASSLWNKYYWLCSTNDLGETFVDDGKGLIQNLINIHFSTKSIIVYSTTDYPVVKIETDENGVLTPVEGTIPGDQYTYDENLDPTTNEYNPLENFVPTNPSQSILGDVDFNEINKVFEENKDILNIENASWLFSANNQLVSYFLGFLLLLIVFLIISRVLGG